MTHYRLTLTKGRGPKLKMIAPLPPLVLKEAEQVRCPQCGLPWYQHPKYPFDDTDRVCKQYVPEVSR